MNKHYEPCLIREAAYPIRVEDGLVLSILKDHTVREAEAVLAAVVEDEAEAKATLKRGLWLNPRNRLREGCKL